MNKLLNILKFFPYVLAGVVAVEGATAPGTPGTTKKQIILNTIVGVAKIGEEVPIPAVQQIAGLIDAVVGSLNSSGVFNHAPASPENDGAVAVNG